MTERLRQSSILDSFSKRSCDDWDLINLSDHTDEEQVDNEESQTQEQQNLSDHTDDSDEEQVDNDDHNVSEALEHEESQTQEQDPYRKSKVVNDMLLGCHKVVVYNLYKVVTSLLHHCSNPVFETAPTMSQPCEYLVTIMSLGWLLLCFHNLVSI